MAQTDTIQVYDQQLQRIAFLQNASNIGCGTRPICFIHGGSGRPFSINGAKIR